MNAQGACMTLGEVDEFIQNLDEEIDSKIPTGVREFCQDINIVPLY